MRRAGRWVLVAALVVLLLAVGAKAVAPSVAAAFAPLLWVLLPVGIGLYVAGVIADRRTY